MNVHTQLQHTPAEEMLLDRFKERFSLLPGSAETARYRDEAIELLKANGLPHRRIEAWHYTDLRRLLARVPPFSSEAGIGTLPPLEDGSPIFSIVNGVAAESPSIDGVSSERLARRLIAGDNSAIEDDLDRDDAIGQINRAFVSDGWQIDLAAGTELARPIELQVLHAGGQAHSLCAFRAGEGTKAVIVERLHGNAEALATHVDRVEIGKAAEITWIVLQEQAGETTGLSRFEGRIAEGAKLTLFVMNAGGKLVRHEIRVDAEGEEADFQLRGVNLLSGSSHTDVTMVLRHIGQGTTSREVLRNVVTGKASGVFQGQIRVDRLAQKTDAKMACNTLLLSDTGEFFAKPELEIFADDVACGHGATVTEIDRNHLFYLMSRGIPERDARGLLVKAFVAEIVEELEDERLIGALESRLESWFAEHG